MADPTTTTTPAPPAPTPDPATTVATLKGSVTGLRQRAAEWHEAADRAETGRYAQRGQALDDATRAAGAARHEADVALQQAQRERAAARELAQDARDLADQARDPANDTRFAQQMATRRQAQARAAEQRAESLERTAQESGARADALDAQVAELREVTDDQSVSLAIRGKASEMDRTADELDRKVRLLEGAESAERDAVAYEAQGDTLNAEVFRDQAARFRADADAIRPEVPRLDERLLRAADVTEGPEVPEAPGGAPGPGPADPTGPATSGPVEPAPTTDPTGTADPAGTPGNTGVVGPARRVDVDSDGDGLADRVERQMGLDEANPDTDGDGFVDGVETAVGHMNPRVRGPVDAEVDHAGRVTEERVLWERARGLGPNADSDGDGFGDWVEAVGGRSGDRNLTADDFDNNLSPLDQFMKSAADQMGKPYRFGAEVPATDTDGGPAYDSGELVEWAAKQAGLRDMPDGSWNQYRYLEGRGGAVPVEDALRTKGALVFGFSSDPLASPDRPARSFVGISNGDGTVIDVSERGGHVRVVDHGGFYTHAAVIPELHRSAGDLDGDGWTDQEEQQRGGDPSRGITTPRTTDPLGADAYAPGATDPTAAAAAGLAPGVDRTGAAEATGTTGADDDPTGSSRYSDPATAGGGVDDRGHTDPGPTTDPGVGVPHADDEGPPYQEGGAYEPRPEDPYGDPAGTDGGYPAGPAPTDGDPAGTAPAPIDTYGDSDGDSYGESYGDAYESTPDGSATY